MPISSGERPAVLRIPAVSVILSLCQTCLLFQMGDVWLISLIFFEEDKESEVIAVCPYLKFTHVGAAGVIAGKFTVDRFGKPLLTVMRLMPPPHRQGLCARVGPHCAPAWCAG
jgi:hypothetical protein